MAYLMKFQNGEEKVVKVTKNFTLRYFIEVHKIVGYKKVKK